VKRFDESQKVGWRKIAITPTVPIVDRSSSLRGHSDISPDAEHLQVDEQPLG
jgi:hypothetical protein